MVEVRDGSIGYPIQSPSAVILVGKHNEVYGRLQWSTQHVSQVGKATCAQFPSLRLDGRSRARDPSDGRYRRAFKIFAGPARVVSSTSLIRDRVTLKSNVCGF